MSEIAKKKGNNKLKLKYLIGDLSRHLTEFIATWCAYLIQVDIIGDLFNRSIDLDLIFLRPPEDQIIRRMSI